METLFEKPPHYSPERVKLLRPSRKDEPNRLRFLHEDERFYGAQVGTASVGQRPSGATARLLQLLESKGVEAVTT